MQSWFTQPDAQGSAPACKSSLLLCGKNAEQKEGEGKKLILVPPPAGKRLQKKVFESKCHTCLIIGGHWLAITDWDARGVVHVN